MSLKSRGDSLLSEVAAGMEKPRPLPTGRAPGTAVGMIVNEAAGGLRSKLDSVTAERDEALRKLAELKELHGDSLVDLDPSRVAPSPFAIRIKRAFEDAAFASLCDDIKRIGGNLAPVLVRPYTGPDKDAFDYELIAGHRRRAACERLTIPVIAIVKDVDDRVAISMMASENENREPESRYELGLHYQKLLDLGKASSINDLALLVGRPRTSVQRCIKAAKIPEPIVELFKDPREIRLEWLDPLIDGWAANQAHMLERAEHVRSSSAPLSSLATFKILTQKSVAPRVKPETIRVNDAPVIKITRTPTGRVSFNFMEIAPSELVDDVLKVVREWQKQASDGGGDD